MLPRPTCFLVHSHALTLVAGCLLAHALPSAVATAQTTLVGNPFIAPTSSWVDPIPARGGRWRLSLHNPTLMETANTIPLPGEQTSTVTETGNYAPMLLIQDGYTTPSTYDLNATMRTNDDDLLGLVFGYQDSDNYFRVGLRQQSPGSYGGTTGLSVQKVSGGTVTQITPNGTGAGTAVITQPMIDTREAFDVRVAVNGANYEVFFNNTSIATGSDAALAAGKIGIQSWAQQTDAQLVTPYWGTEVESVSVKQGANTLYQHSFNSRPVAWRQLIMTNNGGVSTAGPFTSDAASSADDRGNFGNVIGHPWIFEQNNGYVNATAGNYDFIGPAVVVDEAGSAAFTDYELRTRIGAGDNDGLGVLVRVQDDSNFYRVTFANQATGAAQLALRKACRCKNSATACGPNCIARRHPRSSTRIIPTAIPPIRLAIRRGI